MRFLLAGFWLFVTAVHGQDKGELQLNKAEGHLMRYYVSLPQGWTPDMKWPVVVVAEAAEKQYKASAERFVRARGSKPFIIVAPVTTTNGRQGYRDPEVYPYTSSEWDAIDKMGICSFDMDGVEQIVRDVQKKYNGTDKFFVTGFEAGTHLVWAMVFKHPEELFAACPVAGNYRSRCLEDGKFSDHPSRVRLPIQAFYGSQDTLCAPGGKIYYQWEDAKKEALAHGYRNINERVIHGKGHVPLPDEILNYFSEVWNQEHR